MQKHQWKRIAFVVIRGLLLVVVAATLQWGDYLSRLESQLYDLRVINCQVFRPPPEPSLVHLDVDDNALSFIGRWPWPPTLMARIVDEVALTKPKVMAFDVLFAEPRGIVFGRNDPIGVDEDAVLSQSIAKLACGLIPISLKFENSGPPSSVRRLLLPLLIQNPELSRDECVSMLRPHGISDSDLGSGSDSFLEIRDTAFYERIRQELNSFKIGPPDVAQIKKRMLPHIDPLSRSRLEDIFDEEYSKALRELAMERFSIPAASNSATLLHASGEVAPLLSLAQTTQYSGFVDYLPESVEGTVRSVPLAVQYRDRVYFQMGLVAACAKMGVDRSKIRLESDRVILPIPGKSDVVIPVSYRPSTVVGDVGTLMEVPLFGRTRDWLTMYDYPALQRPVKHLSIYKVWQICQTADRLKQNDAYVDVKLDAALNLLDKPAAAAFEDPKTRPTGDKKKQLIQDTLDGPNGTKVTMEGFAGDPDFKKSYDEMKAADSALRSVVSQDEKLESQLGDLRGELYRELHDHAIFLGGTATSLQDLRPTSLFGSSPGVIVHGAIYNAILTYKMWRVTPKNLGLTISIGTGLLTLLLVTVLSPFRAFLGSLTLAVGYLLFNGYYLFDHENLIVAAAGPLVSVGLVWSGMTLTNFLTELEEKSRIRRSFQGYVDPRLVDIMFKDPTHAGFTGQKLEITTCFSDLAGFTTLTDQMGEKIVPLLSEYMGEMIPVIRKHQGYVAQMAGDGIYFLFGAPVWFPTHADAAITAAFDMYRALDDFNVELKSRGLSQLGMRVGVATGEVIVGDTGTSEMHSYTGMGATVNLSARLEPANKVFGSRMLITQRTVELLNGKYLVRPLANLRVAGKLNCVVVYEPLCLMSDTTEPMQKLVDATAKVFEAYRVADFQGCINAAIEMDEVYGHGKFTKLYTRLCLEHLDKNAPLEHCEGQIILTEK